MFFSCELYCKQCPQFDDVAVFENHLPVTDAKFIIKNSLFILLPGVIRLPKLKLISEQKAEDKSVVHHIANAML